MLDHDTFDLLGPWEQDRGDQFFAYDGWWHLNHDTMITSEWATPSLMEDGLDPGWGAWMAKLDANTDGGGMNLDPRFFPHGDDFRGLRVHQTRLAGGEASSDSYCFTG